MRAGGLMSFSVLVMDASPQPRAPSIVMTRSTGSKPAPPAREHAHPVERGATLRAEMNLPED